MPETALAITTEYVRCFLALIGTNVIWPESVLRQMRHDDIDPVDVMHVLTHSDVIDCEKETADGATMVTEGFDCDETGLRVEFWAHPDQMRLRILAVARI